VYRTTHAGSDLFWIEARDQERVQIPLVTEIAPMEFDWRSRNGSFVSWCDSEVTVDDLGGIPSFVTRAADLSAP